MVRPIDELFEPLSDLCSRNSVRRLELIGCANIDRFDEQNSDLDFLVEYLPGTDLGPWPSRYFELQ